MDTDMTDADQIPPIAIAMLRETYGDEPIPLAMVEEFIDLGEYRDFEYWLAYAICRGEMAAFDHEEGYRFRATLVTNLVRHKYPVMHIYRDMVDWHNLLAYWIYLAFTEDNYYATNP